MHSDGRGGFNDLHAAALVGGAGVIAELAEPGNQFRMCLDVDTLPQMIAEMEK